MVAFTPIYDLPYQEGSDPPCFGPGAGCDNLESVWCDFAALVEAQLDENDLIIGRTSTSIPMARVRFLPDTVNGPAPTVLEAFPAGFLAFDSVEFDTDNMASLPFGITPRRNGIYRIDATMAVGNADEIGLSTAFATTVGSEPNIATLNQVVPSSGFLSLRASTLYEFSGTGPLPRTIRITEWSSIASTATVFAGSLSVYWHSDL